jgi:hypothetical protein
MGEGKPSHRTEAKSTFIKQPSVCGVAGEVLDPEIVFEVEEDGTFFYSAPLECLIVLQGMGL